MLERASTCLETGGRQLFRTRKQHLRSRRMLHASFWHHGANDISLPIWWATAPTFDPTDGDVDDCRNTPHSESFTGQGGVLLDFLYPARTLDLIRRISRGKVGSVEARRRPHAAGSGLRHFSTSQWRAKKADDNGKDGAEALIEDEARQRLSGTNATEALRTLLSADEDENQELAWRLYLRIKDHDRTSELQGDLLKYLASATASVDSNRIIQLFDKLPREDRRGSSYRAVISAYLDLEMVGSAVQLHEEAAAHRISIDFGTDQILHRTVRANQWELSLRVCKAFLRCAASRDFAVQGTRISEASRAYRHKLIWGVVSTLPYLRGHLESFLLYLEQFRHELTSTQEERDAVQYLLENLAPEAMEQVLNADTVDEDFIWNFFLGFFSRLRKFELPTSGLYEYSIQRFLSMPRYREYTNRRKIFLELYLWYKNDCLSSQSPTIRPSRWLLRKLLIQVGTHGSVEAKSAGVKNLVQDAYTFYPQRPFDFRALRYLQIFHADRGEVDEVQKWIDEMQRSVGRAPDIKELHSLVFACARRVDVRGTEKQFARISEDFGLTPDVGAWNALLLVYVRADDLDGALACFNRCLDAGIHPDLFTFGPLLDLCAARGDVEAYEALLTRAEQFQIPVRNNVRAMSGFVQACLKSGDPEGAEAIATRMLKSQGVGSSKVNLTYVWNNLIQYHAIRGDVGKSRQLYRQMVQNKIPLDTWTYAALMRSLIEVRQTNAAFRILRVTLPNNNMRVTAFHYALVITGFIRERQYAHAVRAQKRMMARNVDQTPSSKLASLQALGVAELNKLAEEGDENPRTRLVAVEESLREILLRDSESEIARRQPQHGKFIESKEHSVPEGYFGLLILLYSTRGAYDICKELFEAASMAKATDPDYRAPITLLTAIMEAHLQAKEYDEVAKCFELARTQADKLVKTLRQVVDPRLPTVEFDSIVDPAIMESFKDSHIATNRRQVLYKATRIYIRSLSEQKGDRALEEAQRTIRSLLSNGFILDNLTWNEFVQMLALRGRLVDAFTACETYLMPTFTGWRTLNPYYYRKNVPGHIWMKVRHYDVGRTTVMPRYKTLVILAAAFAKIRRDEANGMGWNPDLGGWTKDILQGLSPNTVRAIETMPQTGDKLQLTYLSSV